MPTYLHKRIQCHANFHDIYNIDRTRTYDIKSPSKTSSPPIVAKQKRCVPNMNEEYADHERNDLDIRDSSDDRDITDYPPNIRSFTHFIKWRPESSKNVAPTTETPFELFCNLDSTYTMTLLLMTSKMRRL